jgi:competence protein ComEC
MRAWHLPAAAGAFGAGILASGPLAEAIPTPVLAGVGMALAASAGVGGGSSAIRSGRLLARAGLAPGERSPRERVLDAAGVPTGLEPRAPAVRSRARWRVAAALLGLVLLGSGWAEIRAAGRGGSLAGLGGRWVRFEAVAAADARTFPHGWGLEADLVRVEADGRTERRSARVWIEGSDRAPSVAAGEPMAGSGVVEPLLSGESSFDRYLLGRGVAGRVEVTDLRLLGPARNVALRLANAARDAFRRGAERILSGREAGLLLGLAIGDTTRMDPEVEEDFRATGLGHLLAVSGSNVAMFLVPVLAVAGALGGRRRVRVAVGFVAVGFFALLTRWEPSVLRAGAMASLALVALWAGRPRSTASLLGGAVLALLVVDPSLAASVGFQLSIAATAGLAAMAGPLASRLRWLPRPVALAASATVAAQAAVTPLLLWRFGVVPTVTLAANVLAFAAVGPALLAGVAAAGVAGAWPEGAGALGRVASLPLRYLIALADGLARLPLPSLAGAGALMPLAAGLVVAVAVWRLRRGRRPVGSVLIAVAAGVAIWSAVPHAGGPSQLTITFLDVGQGDAAVVRSPGGATILVDAGPEDDQVAAELGALGVRRVDLAVATHAHADHVEGFPAILARYPVSLLIEPGCPADSPSYAELLAAVADESVPVRHPRGGQRFQVGDLSVEVLGPDACSGGESPNDDSLVLRVSRGPASVLFSGDAEVPAQEDLLADGDPVVADVLKVPHHGGDTSTPELFEAVGARVAVVSTGPNDYGHPHPDVLRELAATGATVLRTDLAGTVTVRFVGDDVLVQSAGG